MRKSAEENNGECSAHAWQTFVINDDRQCLNGNKFIFTSTSTNQNNPSYSWDFGDGNQVAAIDSFANYSYKNSGYFYVKLKVTNTGSCASERIMSVTLIPKPIASFSFPQVICEKQTPVNLIDASLVQDGASLLNNWWWDIGGLISTFKNPTTFVPNNPGPLKVNQVVIYIRRLPLRYQ
jgi:hypothetical protein